METTIEVLKKRIKGCRELAEIENGRADNYRAQAKEAQGVADKHLAEAAMHQRAIEVLKAVEGIQKTGDMAGEANIENLAGWSPWNPWSGGECPVDGYVEVDVLLRGDRGPCTSGCLGKDLRWDHQNSPNDIVAWRLHVSE